METALGAANWLLDKVLKKLSDDLVAGYVASSELGLNFEKIKTDLKFTLGLLHAAQGRNVSNNPGLQSLLEDLSKKADEAEDALDELHYFMIQDELDGTREAAPDVGDGLRGQVLHVRHAARHNVGNWLSCFTCCRSQGDADVAVVTDNPHNTQKAKSDNHSDGHGDKLPFDRVAMSNKIKLVIESMHSLCDPVSKLLTIDRGTIHQTDMAAAPKRAVTSSKTTQKKLYGRDDIFDKTINEMTNGTYDGEILSVIPIVGPGGIGKTTFTQHLYNDKKTEEHFTVRVWICVSTNFDVLRLTKEILSCITATENDGSKTANDSTNNLDQLQKSIEEKLKNKRFLIVLDDIWQCSRNEWKKLLAPFTNGQGNKKGNLVLVTSRLPKIAEMVGTTNRINLEGLKPDEFWNFFQACIFGEAKAEHDKDELVEIAREIADKLKSSPLAAETVGRLLKKKPSREHWMRILENKEWLIQNDDDDIMPALKISYDYLPFHLKKCFSFCALFPEDHRFDSLETIRFWIAIGILNCSNQNDQIEDKGSMYLDELVDNGFLKKGDDNYYVMHDLFHELAQTVSSQECINISSSSFRAYNIPPYIRHLSFTMEGNGSKDFEEEIGKLVKKLDVANLCTLMFLQRYGKNVSNFLLEAFKEMKSLRVLFIFIDDPTSLPHNFSKLIHLRYLKIGTYTGTSLLPTTISRFYHLKFLDLEEWYGTTDLPKNISRLVNLCHFLAQRKFHSNVPEIGKMKHLQELKEFHVRKESVGFEMRELGNLTELGGELTIHNLESVRTKEEASEAKLMEKRNLNKLKLVWGGEQLSVGADVLDCLEPHSNLRALCIVNLDGATGPSWLCDDFRIKNLESLHLEDVSWTTLPPFGQIPHLRKLKLIKVDGLRQFRLGFTNKSFQCLKRIVLKKMPELVEWVGDANCHFYPMLERIECINCPNLSALPFLVWSGPSTHDINTPHLCSLLIKECPKLSLPPMPHTSTLIDVHVNNQLSYEDTELYIDGYGGDLAFHNLAKVEEMNIRGASHISLTDLQKLKFLRVLRIGNCEDTFFRGLDNGVVLGSVQVLSVYGFPFTGKSLSNLFKCFPALCDLCIRSDFPNEDHEEVVLQLPSSSPLRTIFVYEFKNLILPVEGGGVVRDLTSLQSLKTFQCGRIFSGWSKEEATQILNPFPDSLKELEILEEPSMRALGLLSNLTSLTSLHLRDCCNLTMDGFNPLMTFNLKTLSILRCGSVLSEVARTEILPAGTLGQLEELEVDCISAVLVGPICSLISAKLKKLHFCFDERAESFTEEQEKALQLLSSLQDLWFINCSGLQSLPQGLSRLSSLEDLLVFQCRNIRSLPEEGLPASLRMLSVYGYADWLQDERRKLEGTMPDLLIRIYP